MVLKGSIFKTAKGDFIVTDVWYMGGKRYQVDYVDARKKSKVKTIDYKTFEKAVKDKKIEL